MSHHKSCSPSLLAPLARLHLIASHTLGEALRMRLALLLGFVGAGAVLGALALRDFNFGAAELKFIADFGLGAVGCFGTLLATLATAQLFFSELGGGAVCCILTRPVRRWEYLGGKFAGIAALLGLFTAALGGLLAGLLAWRGAQLGAAPFAVPAFLGACAALWLKMTLVAAMTLFVCSYAGSALFASCAGLLLALVAQLRPLVNTGGHFGWLRFWPNLALFDAESLFGSGLAPSASVLLAAVAYWAVYVLLFGALAAVVFERREF